MKNILLALLLCIGTVSPSLVSAKGNVNTECSLQDIQIFIEGWVLSANAGDADGYISEIQIYNINTGEMVRSESCDGYSCSVSLKDIPAGFYVAIVVTTNTIAKKQFHIG